MSDHTDRDDDQAEPAGQDESSSGTDETAPGIAAAMSRVWARTDRDRSAYRQGRMGG